MSKTVKPAAKPTSNKNDIETDLELGKISSARQDFLIAAANMSWQLALVVLIPVIGGVKLDEHFNTLPVWTIIGFVVALVGMAAVVWRQLQIFSPKISEVPKTAGKKSKGGRV